MELLLYGETAVEQSLLRKKPLAVVESQAQLRLLLLAVSVVAVFHVKT